MNDAARPYVFHLTSTVRDAGDAPWRAYKLEALQISARAEGFRWALLVRAETEAPRVYYHVAAWDSEAALDRSGTDPELVRCIEQHRPYDHMVTTPALREVVEPLADAGRASLPARAAHTTYAVREQEADRFAAWYRSARDPSVTRRMLLRCTGDRRRYYGLELLRRDAATRRPDPPGGLLAEPPRVVDAEPLLVIPA